MARILDYWSNGLLQPYSREKQFGFVSSEYSEFNVRIYSGLYKVILVFSGLTSETWLI